MKKLINCKTCGAQMARDAKVCPQCGAKNKMPAWAVFAITILIVIIVVTIFIMFSEEPVKNENDPANNTIDTNANKLDSASSDSQNQETTANETIEDAQQNQSATIYEDDYVKVDYIDLSKLESIDNYIYLYLERLNKTDKTITYRVVDGSVNGYAIPLMIENGASVEPGFSHRGAISIPTNDTNAKTPEEVSNIRFKIAIFDYETWEKIYETDYINIDF